MHNFRLYYKENCHLCDDMLHELQPFLMNKQLSLELVEITQSATLTERWGEKIPVLATMQDKPICVYFFDADLLNAYIS